MVVQLLVIVHVEVVMVVQVVILVMVLQDVFCMGVGYTSRRDGYAGYLLYGRILYSYCPVPYSVQQLII